MGKTKPRGKYQSVSLPVPFIQEIKDHIMKNDNYKSIAEYVKAAVREKMGKRTLQEEEEYTERLELQARQHEARIKTGEFPKPLTRPDPIRDFKHVKSQQSDNKRLNKIEKTLEQILKKLNKDNNNNSIKF